MTPKFTVTAKFKSEDAYRKWIDERVRCVIERFANNPNLYGNRLTGFPVTSEDMRYFDSPELPDMAEHTWLFTPDDVKYIDVTSLVPDEFTITVLDCVKRIDELSETVKTLKSDLRMRGIYIV